MIRCLAVVLVNLLVVGCQADRWGPYVSPRITGQVLAADTVRPIAGVSVSRGRPDRTPAGRPRVANS